MIKASAEYREEVRSWLAQTMQRFDIKVKDAGWKSKKIKVELSEGHPNGRPTATFLYYPNRIAADIEDAMNMVTRDKRFGYAFEFHALMGKTSIKCGQSGTTMLFVLEPREK